MAGFGELFRLGPKLQMKFRAALLMKLFFWVHFQNGVPVAMSDPYPVLACAKRPNCGWFVRRCAQSLLPCFALRRSVAFRRCAGRAEHTF